MAAFGAQKSLGPPGLKKNFVKKISIYSQFYLRPKKNYIWGPPLSKILPPPLQDHQPNPNITEKLKHKKIKNKNQSTLPILSQKLNKVYSKKKIKN